MTVFTFQPGALGRPCSTAARGDARQVLRNLYPVEAGAGIKYLSSSWAVQRLREFN